jgi:hypothetical protein
MGWFTVNEAAEELGISGGGVRYRMKTGALEGRWKNDRWEVHLNGDEAVAPASPPEPEISDELTEIADDLIAIGRRMKRAIKEHDADVRREAVIDFAATLAETVGKGR